MWFNYAYLTHKYAALTYLVIFLVRAVLLVASKKSTFERASTYLRIPGILSTVLFLLAGIYLLTETQKVGMLLWIKLAGVMLFIPLGVMAFRKQSKVLAVVAVLLLFGIYGLAEVNKKKYIDSLAAVETTTAPTAGNKSDTPATGQDDPMAKGQKIYQKFCQNCHGYEGDAGVSGAANLQTSDMKPDKQKKIILKGKNAMPGFKLTDDEADAVIVYINSLRK